MKNLLMALLFLGFTSLAFACPCNQASSDCPGCGKAKTQASDSYKDKKIYTNKANCPKCAKKDAEGKVKKD
ncbi:MAG: hypothetical protein GXN94_00120 [Aquificae bacterium]|nr:hypothetical protein [Aquificota bacterium]